MSQQSLFSSSSSPYRHGALSRKTSSIIHTTNLPSRLQKDFDRIKNRSMLLPALPLINGLSKASKMKKKIRSKQKSSGL